MDWTALGLMIGVKIYEIQWHNDVLECSMTPPPFALSILNQKITISIIICQSLNLIPLHVSSFKYVMILFLLACFLIM